MRTPPSDYLALDLRAHDIMRGVPLHDVSVVDLPGGGAGRTLAEVRALMEGMPSGVVVAALMYQFPREMLAEIRNSTVHAFLSTAIVPAPGGYRFYWAVYMKPMSWFTRWYLAAIEPFRRFLVYPSMLRRIRAAWIARYSPPERRRD